jgi:polyhydroxyalkanoate synthase
VISWVNPMTLTAIRALSDYVKDGPVAALHAIEQATGEREADLVSYCLGGTLSALALAYLAATGEGDRVASATLIATLLDFSELGDWSVFMDENHLSAFRRYLDHKGYVEAHDLAKLFSLVRANDLIWSNVVTHYLMGEEGAPRTCCGGSPTPRACRRPCSATTASWCCRATASASRAASRSNGVPLDLSRVTAPVTIVSLRDDHVSGWEATYAGTKLFGGETRFVLGGSGHNAGMINPPTANKHGFWVNPNGELPDTAEDWLSGAVKQDGSWWPHWQSWLDSRAADDRVPAREIGAGGLPAIESAPGSYVRVRH